MLVAFGAICGGARAADLPSHTLAPAYSIPPVLTWSGFYIGANVGGGAPASRGTGGVIGGGQIGYNYQFLPTFVVGLETDIQGSSVGGDAGSPPFGSPPGGVGSRGVDWFGTVRGRVGTTVINPALLVYGTGGFAYGGSSGAQTGWTSGGGVEWAFASNWSAKVEYLYVDLSGEASFGPHRHGDQAFHVIRAGLDYRFDPFAPLPKSF
ncbi:outer membrane protein [Methylosinus sp. H3A]|uniref:outer membrane protein n=1 Tax=Methylosinus sp. H3A TaxID=2785786 RepID=UPI001FEE45CC|nr:outer membrane beta-barrel protein [Methylosinus sp. H3A]